MRKRLFISMAVLLLLAASALPTSAMPAADGGSDRGASDDISHPLGDRQRELRAKALEAQVRGKAEGRVADVGGDSVELAAVGVDQLFVLLGEFGNQIDPTYGGDVGPLHNQIPQPDRSVDNSTIWQSDYNLAHYEDMYFNQMLNYYAEQSSGQYSFSGAAHDWVEVPYNEARYGNDDCGSTVCATVWDFLADSASAWYAGELAAGKSTQEIRDYLKQFDVWDRYDWDGDGNFDEPDGYIDHMQMVHAGVGQETGGGLQGEDAIWSHRWYTYFELIGVVGPADGAPFGGFEIGDTDVWVGDYTIQPENGGLGVFAHEYAHDLGLPDAYDTSGGENGTGFWTIMSSGSYLGPGLEDIGSRPGGFNAWEKFQLGWLTYEVAYAGETSVHRVAPLANTGGATQAVFVVLPDRHRILELADPPEGELAWYSDSGDNLDNTMTSIPVLVPTDDPTLRMSLWYEIEEGWDYAYARVSTDDGATWTNLAGNLTTNDNPNGQNFGNGITGSSGDWVDAEFDMGAYAGQTVQLSLRYWTDGAVVEPGILADAITLGDFFSGAEAGDEANWTLDGFRTTDGSEEISSFNAYVAEVRAYQGYDRGLSTGPYNFSFLARPDYVEHFPYQNGLLISYWDDFYTDNNTSQHPGEGLILPVDSHPQPLVAPNRTPWRARVQMYDATFGLEATDALTLSFTAGGVQYGPTTYPSRAATTTFDDRRSWWSPKAPLSSVIVPKTGTIITVVTASPNGMMQIRVTPA